MGTGNFYYDNILAVIPNSENEFYDEQDIKYLQEQIYKDLEKLTKNKKLIQLQWTDKMVDGYSNSFGGHSISRVFLYLWEQDYVWFDIIYYNGYYSGANVDYKMEAEWNNYSEKHILNHPSVVKMQKEIIKIIRKYTEKYIVSARFSSGETHYERVD